MAPQVWATAPLVQAGSDSVLDREDRSLDRLACSRPVPSCRVSRDVPMLSSASLVSRMAGAEGDRGEGRGERGEGRGERGERKRDEGRRERRKRKRRGSRKRRRMGSRQRRGSEEEVVYGGGGE